ncbi:MAG TPA: glycosyltransferase [Actinomycetes bacterium]|nr:glycosyltransferase [Actinomycetes bacterium]
MPSANTRSTPAAGRRAGSLLVASAGGHLTQLHQLLPRLDLGGAATWVTFDTPQARSLLAGEEVVFARYTAPRDVRGVLANTALAARLLRGRRFHTVISTGSGVALSFLPLARAAGARVHYIESATRVLGPSATGRLLARVPGIHLYTQHAGWADRRWRHAGSVLDGWTSERTRPQPIRRAVVTLGTMRTYGFRRLLERLVEILPPDVETLWQTGCTDTAGLPITARPAVPAHELDRAMRAADVVVTHAGTGSALAALRAGHCPVLVPRTHALGEHVDDHQHQTAREFDRRGLAITAIPDRLGYHHLSTATARRVRRVVDPPRFPLTGLGGVSHGRRGASGAAGSSGPAG